MRPPGPAPADARTQPAGRRAARWLAFGIWALGPALGATAPGPPPGSTAPDLRIAGGTPAASSDFGFVASITSVDPTATGKSCSGALVHERLVMTTANCLTTGNLAWFDPRYVSVSFGAESYNVSQALMSNEYQRATFHHNIGIILLASPVPKSVAAPVGISSDSLAPTTPVYAISRSATGNQNGARPGRVQVAQLAVLDGNSCGAYAHFDPATQLCAAAAKCASLCAGDEGAPLVVPHTAGGYALAGVASYSAAVNSKTKSAAVAAACGGQIVYFERGQAWAGWLDKTVLATFNDIGFSLHIVTPDAGIHGDRSSTAANAVPGPDDGFIEGPLSQRMSSSAPPTGGVPGRRVAAALAVAAATLLALGSQVRLHSGEVDTVPVE
ncbi:hypothetical protein LPJ61_004667 [Coemansia biformis]|uniref:Peptidase S1 domain-containing protein n=1 Tax=Coemansia biformis TaxID=1286918 RepID=A0A9W7Y856_9FUNG|nr:hypothetical protein LPJ61_004667 [Coemansia biformis]